MKTARIRKTNKKEKEEVMEESYSIKSMIITTLIIFVIFGIFYFITMLCAKPQEVVENPTPNTQLDSSKITLSHLLDRKENEYYALATMKSKYNEVNNKINYSNMYQNAIEEYSNKEDALTFYYVDLEDAFNKEYLSESTVISNNLDEIKISDEVLFKISNKQIVENFVGHEQILDELSKIKES